MKGDEQLVVIGQGMYMLAASAQQQALLEEELNRGYCANRANRGAELALGAG